MSLGGIAIRCLFTYLFLLLILRLSGKRTIAQGTPFDFIAALIMGDLVDDMFWAEVPAAQFVVAAGTLMTVHLLVSISVFLSPAFGNLVIGSPVEIIRDGALAHEGMRQECMNEQEVITQLRNMGETDLREAGVCHIENSGHPGLLKRPWARRAQKQDVERVRKRKP